MSFLSRLSLANRSIVALATIAVIVFGAVIIPSLKQELLPSLQFPAISVVAVYPGASPEIVENDVTKPLEQNIEGVQGLQQLTSYSNEGAAFLIASFDYGADLDKARQTLSEQISKAQSSLPSNVTPQVQAFNLADLPVIRLAVTSSANQQDLATNLNQNVVPVLQGINGVGDVTVTGVRDQVVTITLDLKKLQSKGISVSQVQGALQANNLVLPAGDVDQGDQKLSIRAGNTLGSLDDLKNVIVGVQVSQSTGQFPGTGTTTGQGGQQTPGQGNFPGQSPGGQSQTGQVPGQTGAVPGSSAQQQPATPPKPVKLSDVAKVEQTLAPSTTLTRTNGQPSLGISVTKTSDGNTVAISRDIQQRIADLQQKLGNNAKITVVSDQAPTIERSIQDLVREGLIGAGFAILVILIFLLSIRSTLVTAISIPLSVIIALIGLWVSGYSLNVLTLGGLTIAIGRVVDDSIVVLENIFRHLNSGEDKRSAVVNGVREVATAITASTLTTVAVFLPIAFTSGLVSQFFQPFSITVTIALLASLLVALTIIPVLAYWFLKAPKQPKPDDHERMTWLERAYVPLIRFVTRFRVLTIIASLLILVGTFALFPFLETNLFGSQGSNTFSVSLQMPPGTNLARTDAAARRVENVLRNTPDVKTYQVTVGSGGSFLSLGSGGSNSASFAVTSNSGVNQEALQNTIRKQVAQLTDVGTVTVTASNEGGNSSNVQVNVQANNDTTLRQAAQQVLDTVKQTPGLRDVSSNLTAAAPLIDVKVDAQKAILRGLTSVQVAQSLRTIYTGTTVTTVTLNGTQQDVELRYGTVENSVESMRNLLIPTATGTVKLGDIATVQQIEGPTQITHIDTNRTATVSGTVIGQNVGAVSSDLQARLSKVTLPAGASYELGGVTAQQQDTFRSLGLALLAAILLVYVIMVGTFRSLLQPLILLISIPFAATGSIILLLLTKTALGLPSLIGLLMLVGIVVTNAIVLLDLVNQYRAKGLSAREAVIEGGRRRLRPILMTAIATILALMPMALNIGESSGFLSRPLAIVVIGGLASSTLLTLLLVPTLYTIVEDIRGRGGRKEERVGTDGQVAVEAEKQGQPA